MDSVGAPQPTCTTTGWPLELAALAAFRDMCVRVEAPLRARVCAHPHAQICSGVCTRITQVAPRMFRPGTHGDYLGAINACSVKLRAGPQLARLIQTTLLAKFARACVCPLIPRSSCVYTDMYICIIHTYMPSIHRHTNKYAHICVDIYT